MYHPGNGLSELEIKKHWLDVLPICETQLRKFTILDINKSKKPGKIPYGTGVINVHLTELKQLTMGGIEYLKSIAKF